MRIIIYKHNLSDGHRKMHNISLCNVIDKTTAKYFTQAKYFTVYDETTMSTLCPLYVVNPYFNIS